MQIKTTMKYHYTNLSGAKIKNSDNTKFWQTWEKLTHKLLMKISNDTGIMENRNLAVSYKAKHGITHLDTYSK